MLERRERLLLRDGVKAGALQPAHLRGEVVGRDGQPLRDRRLVGSDRADQVVHEDRQRDRPLRQRRGQPEHRARMRQDGCADAGSRAGQAATAPEKRSSATARKVARLDIEENDDSLLQGMRGVACIAVACAGFLAAGSAPAAQTRMLPVQLQARVAVKRAVQSGWIDNATASRSRAAIDRAARLIRRLPSARADPIDVALSEIAAMSGRLTRPRALALTGQLKANNDYFARRGPAESPHRHQGRRRRSSTASSRDAASSSIRSPSSWSSTRASGRRTSPARGGWRTRSSPAARTSSAASRGSTTSTTAAEARRGSPAWRRRSPRWDSHAQRTSCPTRRRSTSRPRAPRIA